MGQRSDDSPVSMFGVYLMEAITKAGFASPTAFARATKHDPSVVLRWINGQSMPRSRTLAAVAPVLKVRPADLIAAAYPDVGDDVPLPYGGQDPDPPEPEKPAAEPADVAAEMMTAPGIFAHLYAEKIELAHLIANSPLDAEQRFNIIREHRRRQNEFTQAEEARIRAEIEKLTVP